MPSIRPNFSAISLLDSPRHANFATCRRRLVNARNGSALADSRFIIIPHTQTRCCVFCVATCGRFWRKFRQHRGMSSCFPPVQSPNSISAQRPSGQVAASDCLPDHPILDIGQLQQVVSRRILAFPPPWSVAISRRALAADAPCAFRRRCLFDCRYSGQD